MEKNISNIDRWIRAAVSMVFFGGGMYIHNPLVTVVGLMIFLTAVTQFCFLYKLLKINTNCKIQPKD